MLLRNAIRGLLAATALTSTAFAESPLTKDQLEAVARLDSVTIPSPGEFFVALDKQSQPNWPQLFKPIAAVATSSREQMALMLGIYVADGYIAVEAQDSQGVKNVGKDIINLAKRLNVNQSVLGRGNSINDFAANNDWSALREELEATQNEVKLAMAEQKDQALVTLVTLGAWIRGTEVAASYISENYTPQLAELVRQPAIVTYLLDNVSTLPEKVRQNPLMVKIEAGLRETLGIVTADLDQPLPDSAIRSLATVMAGMVTEISREAQQEP